MHPILFVLGPITVYSFGFMLAIAVLVCSYLLGRDAQRLKIGRDVIYDFVFMVALAGIIGARIFYILLDLDFFMQNPLELFQIQHGGLAWQGGLIAGIIAAVSVIKRKQIPLFPFLDLVSPYAALGQAIGRIGCFLNGCCYGKSLVWGIYVPVYHARLHPTQLYESLGLFIVFLILRKKSFNTKFSGEIMVWYLLMASLLRLVVQFFRYDYEPIFLGLGIYQMICVGILIGGVIVLNQLKRRLGK